MERISRRSRTAEALLDSTRSFGPDQSRSVKIRSAAADLLLEDVDAVAVVHAERLGRRVGRDARALEHEADGRRVERLLGAVGGDDLLELGVELDLLSCYVVWVCCMCVGACAWKRGKPCMRGDEGRVDACAQRLQGVHLGRGHAGAGRLVHATLLPCLSAPRATTDRP